MRPFAVAIQDGELHQQHGQPFWIFPDGVQGGFDPGYITVVIGPPNINHPVKAAFEFFQVVGDVGCEIGGLAVFPAHHPILFIAEGAGAKP